MATGLLQATGTIDLAQFWPNGESEADTVRRCDTYCRLVGDIIVMVSGSFPKSPIEEPRRHG